MRSSRLQFLHIEARIGPPPGASPRFHHAVRRMARPVEQFLRTEAAAGGVLLAVALLALGWANSPWADAYHAIWSTPFGIELGDLAFTRPLSFWIGDVLMTLFFFVVGLEIRREIARGELSDRRRAALPVAAALGGMVVPAMIFAIANVGRATSVGWGVPMATDIAFAVGVLAVLGKRVPPALRILLLALAVIDDVGAILVIGVFYSHALALGGLLVAVLGIVIVLGMQRFGVRAPSIYVLPGAVIWWGIQAAGIHPTVAGVVLGLMTPARAWFTRDAFVDVVSRVADDVRETEPATEAGDLVGHLDSLDAARREVVAPIDQLQRLLHRWVAFVVMPLFAFANAGVTLGSVSIDADAIRVLAGIALGLVVGKPVGIVLGAWLATRLGVAALPAGVSWRGVLVVGLVGGIGFTMSLFVAELAFDDALLEVAKLGIVTASAAAGVIGLGAGALLLARRVPSPDEARTEVEAEMSTAR
jgi:NhaA family Na+:H+ antiporter